MAVGSKYDCQSPIYLPQDYWIPFSDRPDKTHFLRVSCGHCLPCRIKKSKEWSTRMMMELRMWNHATFITLTYSDDNLPILGVTSERTPLATAYCSEYKNSGIDVSTSEILSQVVVRSSDTSRYPDVDFLHATLYYKDFQDFMKRLRKRYCLPVKFYCCGEYGSLHERPHFHAIIFGPTREWMSSNLPAIWKYGFTYTEDCNVNSVSYVAGYVQKKLYVPSCDREFGDQIQEFHHCSNGIGKSYFELICNTISEDDPFISFGSERRPVPRTFKRYMYSEDFCNSVGVSPWRKLSVSELIENQIFEFEELLSYCRSNSIEPRDIFRANFIAISQRVNRWKRHTNFL